MEGSTPSVGHVFSHGEVNMEETDVGTLHAMKVVQPLCATITQAQSLKVSSSYRAHCEL